MSSFLHITNPWKGLNAHISQPGGKVKRCKIGDWGLDPLSINMIVEFQQEGKKKKKSESPITLAAINAFWVVTKNLVAADTTVADVPMVASDPDEDVQDIPSSNQNPKRFVVDVPLGPLPKITLSELELSLLPPDLRKSLIWTVKQTNNILDIAFPETLIKDT
jgi:hypothetical protein